MTRLVFILMAFFLAMPIVYFLPLGLTATGSFVLLGVALLIAGSSFAMEPYVPIWHNLLVCFLLVVTMAYFVSKYMGHKVMSERSVNKKERASENRFVTREKVMKDRKEEKQLAEIEEPPQKAALFEANHDKAIVQAAEENEPLYINEEVEELNLEEKSMYEKEGLKPIDKELLGNELETETSIGEKAASAPVTETWKEDLESLLAREELPVFERSVIEEDSEIDSNNNEKYYLESLFDEIVKEEESSLSITKEKSPEPDRELLSDSQEEDYITPFDRSDFDEWFEEETTELEENAEAKGTTRPVDKDTDLDSFK
ncbi:hypothetical protein AC623_14025 [Bacillus sp. FJAT-27231]|uniref:hypothetical protein n=1 Tax=Bacillus sp. FJAT-27231 TaxID=1679168 RepID=UPI0006710AAE|nr:hypothetical protein [Bacillus sp. FJAT-27231]KMY54914.1 hypothetical protein AC623_14025 [Bacillus sp. FJAT-27231]